MKTRLVTIGKRFGDYESLLLPTLSFAGVLALWEIGSDSGALDTYFFSSPSRVLLAGFREVQQASFWNDVWISSQEFAIGYVGAILIAVPFGIVTGWSSALHDLFDPWLSGFNATPRLAFLPLVVLWVGLGLWSKVVIVLLGVFFPVAVNTFHGVRTVDAHLMEVSSSFGASTWKRLTTVVMPAVLPFSLVGMRIGIGRAVAGVIVAEFFTSNAGLGNLILRAGEQQQTDRLLFTALFVTILALLVFRLASSIEERFRGWRPRVGSA
jgi:NitT/TauT family transport system permease protein